ncbi:cytochrome c oxidase subunit 3 [Jiulongibacter sediminis]|jgi:cytochrome c oxidase subunit 3|uniref:cytochrome c oxidase subunit 3 n=1 Tax=Jiulongibacter sediminis TaxID=1605367 RepID=UPI0026EE034F|nr:cytochrome c oxidase subunit 3 [Jiulongibacter sediminis]
MATTHASSTPDHLIWKGGVQPMKVGYGKLMMWIFLLSDTFTFSALLISYGLVRFSFPSFQDANPGNSIHDFTFSQTWWPTPERVFEAVPFLHGVSAPLVFVGIMTFILIFSSVTMVLAVEAGHRRDKADVEKWMLWTILGGFTFLGSQAWEWSHFIHGTGGGGANLVFNEYGPAAFADFFFFITGFHGTHVFSGVILNILIFYNTVNGVYEKRGHYEMIEKVGLYWHFVDLVWVFVFTFFYLV